VTQTIPDDDIGNLRRIPLFAAFEPAAVEALAYSLETRLLRANDLLFRQGEESDGGYVLILGAVGLSAHDDRTIRHVIRPWALIGEMALVSPSRRPVTARALEPSTMLKITRPFFHQLLEQHPRTAAQVREFFRARLMEFTRHAASNLAATD
jgi:CRP-like cAMP-binding protein